VFIIVGLVLDVLGAILIVRPILYFRGIWTGEFVDYVEKLNSDDSPDKVKNKIKNAWLGVTLLGVGFSLQIYGNYLQYLSLNP